MAREKSPDFGLLQEFVERLYAEKPRYSRLELVLEAEAFDFNEEIQELFSLLPPGAYTRIRLCSQLNSSLSSHGWGYVYGAVH